MILPEEVDMDRPLLIGLGELLWDVLPEGEQLGGAPANFSYHAAALGAEGFTVSTVGRDDRGARALRELAGKGLAMLEGSVRPDNEPVLALVRGLGATLHPRGPELWARFAW